MEFGVEGFGLGDADGDGGVPCCLKLSRMNTCTCIHESRKTADTQEEQRND